MHVSYKSSYSQLRKYSAIALLTNNRVCRVVFNVEPPLNMNINGYELVIDIRAYDYKYKITYYHRFTRSYNRI